MINFVTFCRSEHGYGWLCVIKVRLKHVCDLTVRDGKSVLGVFKNPYLERGRIQIDQEPSYIKEGEFDD